MISKISEQSSTGLVRAKNEDNIISFSFEDDGDMWECFAVADGVGGHNAGEVASLIFIKEIKNLLKCNIDKYNIKKLIKLVITEINDIIYQKSLEIKEYEGMGTTITMALVHKDNLYIGHVGDSRAYLLREGHLTMLTNDHSIVGEMVKDGKLSNEEAMNHPKKNIILQAVGLEDDLYVDYIHKKLKNEDLIVLCTDGFSDLISDKEMEIEFNKNIAKATDKLATLVDSRGAYDNYSIIVVKWVDEKEEETAID